MKRPVRPVALVILTACMIYPGVTMLYQGLYPFVAGEQFMLVSQHGPWMDLAMRAGMPSWAVVAVCGLKAMVGGAWLLGVPGVWAGDARAVPLVLLGALGSLLCPVGPAIMGALALVSVVVFRETDKVVPA